VVKVGAAALSLPRAPPGPMKFSNQTPNTFMARKASATLPSVVSLRNRWIADKFLGERQMRIYPNTSTKRQRVSLETHLHALRGGMNPPAARLARKWRVSQRINRLPTVCFCHQFFCHTYPDR
jgi:hypothetical protein